MSDWCNKHSSSIALFLGGVVVGFITAHILLKSVTEPLTPLRLSSLTSEKPYQYIDPLLAVKGAVSNPGPYIPLEKSIEDIVSRAKKNGDVTAASVYLNDLRLNAGFLIHPDEKYSPASLLKVPMMVAYFKLAEQHPGILNERLTYTEVHDLNAQEHLPSPTQIKAGRYGIDELIEYMIRYSDNNAADLLLSHLNNNDNESAFNDLMRDLGIAEIDLTEDFMKIRAYSIFFRVLYNATYLNRAYSEKALELLTETDFSSGIDAGVPNTIPVAHKFGEFTWKTRDGGVLKNELHDCGIVYYPEHPYMICIMTKGKDFDALQNVIAEISRTTYQYIQSKN